MFKDKIRFIDVKAIVLIGACYIPALVYRLFNRDIWLCSERKDEARDNGYWMYKYVRENHPSQKCYYVISKDSVDRKKIEKYKTLIDHGSLKHYFVFIATRIRMSAHVDADTPNSRVTNFMDRHHLLSSKRVFLQHGITKDKISFGYYNVSKVDLFICGAIPEFDFCKKEFGYPDGSVVLTGFARYDGLFNKQIDKKIIAVIPTWRSWLANLDDKAFIKSDFFNRYYSLLHNFDLLNLLTFSGYSLVFFMHPDSQKYKHLFEINDDRIFVSNNDNYEIQELLCEASLLVTDYSSIAFDFAYLKKPIIYYQFDYQMYRKNQHPEGYFNYYNNGFGPVLCSESDIVEYIKKMILNKWSMETVFAERIKPFFKYFDRDNCLRIYNEIKKI